MLKWRFSLHFILVKNLDNYKIILQDVVFFCQITTYVVNENCENTQTILQDEGKKVDILINIYYKIE